jgi:hypothetical protein
LMYMNNSLVNKNVMVGFPTGRRYSSFDAPQLGEIPNKPNK